MSCVRVYILAAPRMLQQSVWISSSDRIPTRAEWRSGRLQSRCGYGTLFFCRLTTTCSSQWLCIQSTFSDLSFSMVINGYNRDVSEKVQRAGRGHQGYLSCKHKSLTAWVEVGGVWCSIQAFWIQ